MSLLQTYYQNLQTKQSNQLNVKKSNSFEFEITPPCQNKNAVWGSEKPVKETCPPEHLQMVGEPCMNIWNNSTKRKTIVDSY